MHATRRLKWSDSWWATTTDVIYSLSSLFLVNLGLFFFFWCFLCQFFKITKLAAWGQMSGKGHSPCSLLYSFALRERQLLLQSLRKFQIIFLICKLLKIWFTMRYCPIKSSNLCSLNGFSWLLPVFAFVQIPFIYKDYDDRRVRESQCASWTSASRGESRACQHRQFLGYQVTPPNKFVSMKCMAIDKWQPFHFFKHVQMKILKIQERNLPETEHPGVTEKNGLIMSGPLSWVRGGQRSHRRWVSSDQTQESFFLAMNIEATSHLEP